MEKAAADRQADGRTDRQKDRHPTAILSKNVPHLQQEGNHFEFLWAPEECVAVIVAQGNVFVLAF